MRKLTMSVCWFTILEVSPGGNLNLDMEGKERAKKEADTTRLVGGSFHKQGHLQPGSSRAAAR